MTLQEKAVLQAFRTKRPTAKQVSELLSIKKEDARKIIRELYETPLVKEVYNCETMCRYNRENNLCPLPNDCKGYTKC